MECLVWNVNIYSSLHCITPTDRKASPFRRFLSIFWQENINVSRKITMHTPGSETVGLLQNGDPVKHISMLKKLPNAFFKARNWTR